MLIADQREVRRFASHVGVAARSLMDSFWPGAMTIALPARGNLPPECLAGGSTVGLRMPNHDALRHLIAKCGGALAVTSANRSGQPETRTADAAYKDLADGVDVVLDLGPLRGGVPSTVIDMSSGSPRVLRRGAISESQIAAAISSDRASR